MAGIDSRADLPQRNIKSDNLIIWMENSLLFKRNFGFFIPFFLISHTPATAVKALCSYGKRYFSAFLWQGLQRGAVNGSEYFFRGKRMARRGHTRNRRAAQSSPAVGLPSNAGLMNTPRAMRVRSRWAPQRPRPLSEKGILSRRLPGASRDTGRNRPCGNRRPFPQALPRPGLPSCR